MNQLFNCSQNGSPVFKKLYFGWIYTKFGKQNEMQFMERESIMKNTTLEKLFQFFSKSQLITGLALRYYVEKKDFLWF